MGRREMFENGVVISPVEIIGQRDRVILARSRRFVENHDAIGVRIRKRSKQNRVDDAKYRGVRTDAERKRQHSNKSEPGGVTKLTKTEFQVIHVTRCAEPGLGRSS